MHSRKVDLKEIIVLWISKSGNQNQIPILDKKI